jgi:hypothetical protein
MNKFLRLIGYINSRGKVDTVEIAVDIIAVTVIMLIIVVLYKL